MRTSAVLAAVLCSVALGQCPSSGLILDVSGNRLGDPCSVTIAGTPSVAGLIGIDTAGGPISTPIGPICLGLSPALLTLPFALDSSGTYALTLTLPADPALIGFQAFVQAAAADVSQPNGLALSNGQHPTFRPPRIIFYSPGYTSPFGSTPGSFCVYDAMTDVVTTGAIPLPGSVLHAIRVPALGAVAFLLSDASVVIADAGTGATLQTLNLATTPGYPAKLAVEGTTLYALHAGTPPSPFGGGSPGGLRGYSLPSGAPTVSALLSQGNPNDFMIIPGSGYGYLRMDSSVGVVDLVAGGTITTINVGATCGPMVDWIYHSGLVYCLMGGTTNPFGGGLPAGFTAIDTSSQAPVLPSPAAYAVATPTLFRLGPGSTGVPSLFTYISTLSTIMEISIFNFSLLSATAVGPGIAEMQVSPGGTEWLLVCGYGCGGSDPELQSITPPIMAPATVVAVPPGIQTFIAPLPSETLRRAFILLGTNAVIPFQTDPAAPPYSAVQLPVSASNMKAVID
jgi:hypothetical protein